MDRKYVRVNFWEKFFSKKYSFKVLKLQKLVTISGLYGETTEGPGARPGDREGG